MLRKVNSLACFNVTVLKRFANYLGKLHFYISQQVILKRYKQLLCVTLYVKSE